MKYRNYLNAIPKTQHSILMPWRGAKHLKSMLLLKGRSTMIVLRSTISVEEIV